MKSTEQKQEVSKYQKFNTERIHRRSLVGAEYNPRFISDDAKERLKKTIKKVGMVQPPVWNKRTGHLVGGHQRLSVLDMLHKSDDYYLDVAVIDVDDKTEVETNLALNNESIMGEFDVDLVNDLRLDFDLDGDDFKSIGFTDADLDLILDGNFSDMLHDSEQVTASKEKISEIKEARKAGDEKFKEALTDDFYFVVVCDSVKQKEEVLRALKVPEFETYVNSLNVLEAIKSPAK